MDMQELFRSCRTGDVEKVRNLIEIKDIELNVRDYWDSTPFSAYKDAKLILNLEKEYYACLCGHEELVELLLKNGSRCEANTFDGERCLYGALTDKIRKTLGKYNAINASCMRRDLYDEFLRRSFDQGLFADIYFVVQGETIPAHRVILAARSPCCAKLFQTKWKDKTWISPHIAQVNSVQFQNFLKYLYTGKLDVPLNEWQAYMYLARWFGILHIKRLLKRRLAAVTSFGKRSGAKVTMITIDSETEKTKLSEDFAKIAEDAIPDPFRSEQVPEGSLGISWLWDEIDYDPTDFSSLSDVCFDVVGYKFFCNKVFFCHRSDYFKAFFEFSTVATTQDISCAEDQAIEPSCCQITIHDVSPAVFSAVVAYLYTDDAEISLDFENIYNILCAAEMYLLNGLKRLCSNAMSRILDVYNVIDVVRISRTFNMPRLESDCCRYIADVLDQVVNDPSFAEFIEEDAKTIKGRQETDSIPFVDDIRYHLYNALLPSYSCGENCSPEQRLELLENLLKNLGLDC